MKKIWTILMMAVMGLTFTSCEDEEIARTLEGRWQGNMYVQTDYHWQTYVATYTEITFLRDPYAYASGQGYWVDYYSNAPWDYVANNIDWKVNNGIIYVYFVEQDTSIEIRDYRLSGNRFYGTLYDNGNYADFELEYVGGAAGYGNSFRWGYSAWYDDPYYARGTGDGNTVEKEKPKWYINPNLKKNSTKE